MGPGEAAWLDSDRQWALALLTEEKATHVCGQLIEESFHPDNHSAYATDRYICHACADLQIAQQEYADENPDGQRKGTVFMVHKKGED